ncbi:DUF6777 domain-containing protein [Streptomyces sp. NPDC097941]|uniref:DUF6777 domain-containing protein n=1 Tax=Streptomyces sp. NPDC097941 TaxID=3155685 RepID=UPI00332F838C
MRTPTRTLASACALATALLVAGCGGDGGGNTAGVSGALLPQPAAAQGPNPFTRSSATTPPPFTRTPQRDSTAPRAVPGDLPGLYGGTERVGSCDVGRQIDDLTADRSRTSAFARVAGVPPASVPDYLRGLAPVVLRADTRVTDHGYRGGRARGFPSVLQAGTAVLVDHRGVPRVRCAGGNPLTPPVAMRGGAVAGGRPWPGYRPDQVVEVTPSEQVLTDLTIIDLVGHSWIERRIDHDCRHDRAVTAPPGEPLTPTATPGDDPVRRPAPDRATPTIPVPPAATATPPPSLPSTTRPVTPVVPPEDTSTTVPGDPEAEIGPETVPDTPDLPDGGGLIPDDPDAPTGADADADAVPDGPSDVLGA